jgi:hypothetical protein
MRLSSKSLFSLFLVGKTRRDSSRKVTDKLNLQSQSLTKSPLSYVLSVILYLDHSTERGVSFLIRRLEVLTTVVPFFCPKEGKTRHHEAIMSCHLLQIQVFPVVLFV